MHIFFSGIGGTGIGPLALVAKQAGYEVSGSDKQDSQYLKYLANHGINDVHIGQEYDQIAAIHDQNPIDWYVYSSAVAIEQPDAAEFKFCKEQAIHMSKRDELLNRIITEKDLQLIAVAGTHGKTTTTAMAVWTLKQLGVPIGYILPAKSSFAEMGAYETGAKHFVYECDEFDRNFLNFTPSLSLITGIDWDHPDIYPTREDYTSAFREFVEQSKLTYIWQEDATQADITGSDSVRILDEERDVHSSIPGIVNRRNAGLVAAATSELCPDEDPAKVLRILDKFPGVSRRFEQIIPRLYTDYAHTPAKIRGALQLAHEVSGDDVVVVYEGLHNTRQHFIKADLEDLFDDVKELYIVPSYLAREDPLLKLLTPDDLRLLMNQTIQSRTEAIALNEQLKTKISHHLEAGSTVLCLSAGGGGSLDEWLRTEFA